MFGQTNQSYHCGKHSDNLKQPIAQTGDLVGSNAEVDEFLHALFRYRRQVPCAANDDHKG